MPLTLLQIRAKYYLKNKTLLKMNYSKLIREVL